MAPPTVLSLKQSFLLDQTRLLSRNPAPSRTWLAANIAADSPLSQKAIDDALYRVSHILQQHARRVYAPQATRHVAEQIDRLYWDAAERTLGEGEEEIDDGGIGIEVDLGTYFLPSYLPSPPLSFQRHSIHLQFPSPPLAQKS
jgi:hypothetical protein